MIASTSAGSPADGMSTSYPLPAITSSTKVTASEATAAVSVRPASSTHAGTGAARRRFSTPDSRWATTSTTRVRNAAETMPKAASPGVRYWASGTEPARVDRGLARRGADQHAEQDHGQRQRAERGLAVAAEGAQVVAQLVADELAMASGWSSGDPFRSA